MRHSRGGGNPGIRIERGGRDHWIPACAGMTGGLVVVRAYAGMTGWFGGRSRLRGMMACFGGSRRHGGSRWHGNQLDKPRCIGQR